MRGIYSRNRGFALAIVTILFFCLVVNSSWKAIPDGALYLELGESIARGEGYVFNGEPHTYVPPGYPVVVAATVVTVGKSFLAYRFLMACLGLLTAAAGYLLVLRLCGRDTAFLAGGLFAINYVLLYNSTFTSSDVPFALAVFLALHVVISAAGKKNILLWSIPAGIVAGLPALIRINGLGVPPAEAFFLFCSCRGRSLWSRLFACGVFLVASVLPTAAWEVHKASFPESFQEGTYLNAVTGRTLGTQSAIILRAVWDYIYETSYALSGVSLKTGFLELIIPCLALLGIIAAFRKDERLLVPLTLIQFCGLLLSPAGSRYLIVLIPGLYLFLALGVLQVLGWIEKNSTARYRKFLAPKRVVPAIFAVLACINIAHNLVTVVQARNGLERGGAESYRDLPFFTSGRWLAQNATDGVVMTMHPRVIHYLSGLPSVELVRSGVPEHEVWVDAGEQIQQLIISRRPTYFFSDATNVNLYRQVLEALEILGLKLEKVHQVGVSERFCLWRVMRKE